MLLSWNIAKQLALSRRVETNRCGCAPARMLKSELLFTQFFETS